MTQQTVLLVVLFCFVLGYWTVSVLWKKKHAAEFHQKDRPQAGDERRRGQFTSIESYYRHVLGVSESAGEMEIRAAYRSQLAKYHPDKVTHLGDEFYDLASRRTKEIIEAYDFVKSKYGFK